MIEKIDDLFQDNQEQDQSSKSRAERQKLDGDVYEMIEEGTYVYKSAREKISKASEVHKINEEYRQKFEEIISKINLNSLRELAKRQLKVANELNVWRQALAINPNLVGTLHDTILETIERGTKDFAELLQLLKNSGIFDFLTSLRSKSGSYNFVVTPQDIPAFEEELLNGLGLNSTERTVLNKIFDAYLSDKVVSFDIISSRCQSELEQFITAKKKDKTDKSATSLLVNLACSYKAFSGLSIVALNLSAYAGAAGLSLGLTGAVSSMITGGCLITDGIKDLGIWKSKE